jgi:hypothetical protein
VAIEDKMVEGNADETKDKKEEEKAAEAKDKMEDENPMSEDL